MARKRNTPEYVKDANAVRIALSKGRTNEALDIIGLKIFMGNDDSLRAFGVRNAAGDSLLQTIYLHTMGGSAHNDTASYGLRPTLRGAISRLDAENHKHPSIAKDTDLAASNKAILDNVNKKGQNLLDMVLERETGIIDLQNDLEKAGCRPNLSKHAAADKAKRFDQVVKRSMKETTALDLITTIAKNPEKAEGFVNALEAQKEAAAGKSTVRGYS